MFFRMKKVKSVTAGLLAVLVFALPLTGCKSADFSNLFSSGQASSELSSIAKGVSSVISAVQPSSSQIAKAESAVSAAASSVVSSTKAAVAKASSAAAKSEQKVQTKKKAAAKVETGNQNIKKIANEPAQNSATRAVTQSRAAASSGYPYVQQRSGYNALADVPSQNLYKLILASAYQISDKPNAQGYYPTAKIELGKVQLSEAQIRIALMAALNDNPQVFWLANAYSYGYGGGATSVQLYSAVSPSQCNIMIQQLNQKVSVVIAALPSGLSELDRELYLSDCLMKQCTYNTAAAADSSLWKAFNAYGALVEGSVVCEGYARSMQLLSSYAGLQCMLLTGQSDGVNHMWNVIRIDGNWYHLDNTWDDNDPTIYNYFNVTDEVIRQTHSIFPLVSSLTDAQIDGSGSGSPAGCNLVIPSCSATAANYFAAKAIRVTAPDKTDNAAAVSTLVAAANKKSASVSFYVPDGSDYNTVTSAMLSQSPYLLVDYIKEANSSGDIKNRISLTNIRYIQDPANRGLTIFLTYA